MEIFILSPVLQNNTGTNLCQLHKNIPQLHHSGTIQCSSIAQYLNILVSGTQSILTTLTVEYKYLDFEFKIQLFMLIFAMTITFPLSSLSISILSICLSRDSNSTCSDNYFVHMLAGPQLASHSRVGKIRTFPQSFSLFLLFFLEFLHFLPHLVFQVGGLPTLKGPGYDSVCLGLIYKPTCTLAYLTYANVS